MTTPLTNLLPDERIALLRRAYFLRLGVVALVAASVLSASAALLLAPTYQYLSSTLASKNAQLASVTASLSSTDGAALSARLAALSSDTQALAALANAPDAALAVRTALLVPRPGITLAALSYTPPSAKGPGTLSLSGTALTRDALRSYQVALQGSAFATAADLPVSVYAQSTNIAFSILITLAP